MSDLAWLALWLAIGGSGVATVIALRGLGVRATHARDLLHLGAGTWALAWPAWHHAVVPVALAATLTAALALVPRLARGSPLAARLERSVSDTDERWTGLVHYGVAATALTAIALAGHGFAAAAGLWALALGDGPGGAIGRRFGRHRFRVPWAKPKSLEGAATVAIGATVAVLAAGAWFAHPVTVAVAITIGVVAALAEAVAPRSTDNLLVPAAAWAAAELLA